MRRLIFVFLFLGQFAAANQNSDRKEAERLYTEAITMFSQGYFRDAVPVMEHALEIREKVSGPAALETAAVLHELGRFYIAMVFSEKAESALQRALTLREKQLGSNHPDTARTVGLLADYYRKIGELKKAEPLYPRAVEVLEKTLTPEAPDLVEVHLSWSRFCIHTGKYSEAESHAKRAIAIGEKSWGPEHPKVAKALNELGGLKSNEGKNVEAEEIFRRSLAIQEKTIGLKHPDAGETMNRLAILYMQLARSDEAEELLNRLLPIYEKKLGGDHPHMGAVLNNLALSYASAGRTAEAVPLLEKALEIEEKVFGPDHYHVATDLSNLAIFLTVLGRYAEAEPLYKRLLEIRQKNPAPLELGLALNNLALHYWETGRYPEAEPLYKKAAQVWEEGLGAENSNLAAALGNLAQLYLSTERYEEAEPLFQKALTIRKKALGEDHPLVALDLHRLASVYAATGREIEAEELFRKALEIYEKGGAENAKISYTQKSLGSLYRTTGRMAEAESLFLSAVQTLEKTLGPAHPHVPAVLTDLAALYADDSRHKEASEMFIRGSTIHQETRESVFTLLSERQKLTFIQRQTPSIHEFLTHTAKFMANNSNVLEACFTSWLQWKGAIHEAHGRFLDALIHSENPEIQQKWDDLQSARRQIARMWLAGPGRRKLEDYRRLLAEQEIKKETLEAELSRLSQTYALENRVGRADPKRIASLLPKDGVYLDYARIDRYDSIKRKPTDTRYMVFVLAGGPESKLRFVDLGPAKEIDRLITTYREQIQQIVEKGEPSRQHSRQMRKHGRELYQKLIQPIAVSLKGRKHLLVSPDGMLHLIPFEVLIADPDQFLLEKYQITYVASGRDILRWENERSADGEAILMADPDFDLHLKKRGDVLAQMGIRAEQLRGGITRQLKDRNFSRLSASREEAKEIATFLEEHMRIPVQLYLDQQALEEVLMAVESPRILHFATHGYFLEDQEPKAGAVSDILDQGIPDATWEHPSLRSGIVLAGANRSLKEGRDEGLVSAIKIEGLRLNKTELVVLSACDTGVGKIQNGEGVFGLKRSFVLAGAQTVVLSLWKVPDETARQLMTRFYTFWTSGLTKSESLRKARLEILKNYDNPFYWAAFQLVGNPN